MLTLYTYFRSSAAYRVRIALNLKGLAYESRPVHLVRGGGEQLSAAYRAVNPAQLVPALVHEGVTLTQSLPIIEYLEERFPQPPLLPGSPAERARVRALAQTIACEIHPLNNLRVLAHLEAGLGAPEAARTAWYRHWVTQGFTALEALLAGHPHTGSFCHRDTPTLADCCLVPQVFNAERFGVPLHDFPTLVRIAAHARTLDAFARAAPAVQPDAA